MTRIKVNYWHCDNANIESSSPHTRADNILIISPYLFKMSKKVGSFLMFLINLSAERKD
jgi:hypothetical protein